MNDMQPGKFMGRRGHVREGHFRVAPGTGGIGLRGGRGLAIWRALQAIRGGFWEMATPKHVENRSICRQSAGTTADRAGRVCVSCKPKVHHDQGLITFPEASHVGP
jgi:hypothetical protein